MKVEEAKSKLYEDVWKAIRREEEEMSAFPEVDIKALVAESGRAYRAGYVRKNSPAEEENPAWTKEMTALLWKLAMKTRNPVREAITVGALTALPLLPCMAISYYLVVNAGAQSRLGVGVLFLIAGVCLATSLALFLELRRRVKRLGILKFNATFNSGTFWGVFSHTGGGLLFGSTAAILIAVLTPLLLRSVHQQKQQAAVESVQESRANTQSYVNAALELAEKEAVASIERLQDPDAAATIVEGETKVVRDDKNLSLKTTKPAPKVVRSDVSACDPNVSVVVSAECNPFGARVYSTTPGGRSALLTRYVVGRVDSFSEGRVRVRLSGEDGMFGIREIPFDATRLNRPSVGERTIVIIDGASNTARDFKELPPEPSQSRAQQSRQNNDASAAATATVSEARTATVPPE